MFVNVWEKTSNGFQDIQSDVSQDLWYHLTKLTNLDFASLKNVVFVTPTITAPLLSNRKGQATIKNHLLRC